MIKWFKWKIARWLDNRHPEWCWASLCGWALNNTKWADISLSQNCRKEETFKKHGVGWCGKCDIKKHTGVNDG